MENAEKIKSVSERSPLVADSASIGADIPTNNFPEISKPEKTEQLSSESDEPRKNKPSMVVKFAVIFAKKVLILLIGYIFCYFNWSLTLPIVGILSLIWYENLKPQKGDRIRKKLWASSMSKADICDVNFPDRERAEWLNDIISQLWPNLNNYIVKYCRGKIQTNIRKKFDSFRFEDIDFGSSPPKIDGIKVYNQSVAKDSIVIDFEVFYDGDCDVNFSMSGAQIGTIKDFQMGVEIRVVLKPLLFKMPVIGGIQIFFLNVPDIEFELEGITGIPGFSYLVRQKIEEIIKKKLVFPNKITKRFSKAIEAAELKSIEPAGVLRVHVFEARDLEKKDVTGKSDPYVILHVGAQELKTQVIKRDLNPQWDYYCEFIILDPEAQQLYFKLFDQDEFREDDFLGSGAVDISEVIKPGKNDQWFNLENVKHGKIHLRFSWLGLTSELNALNLATQETKLLKTENLHAGLLTLYVDSAINLPKIKFYKKPDPYIILTVGDNQTKSRRRRHTCDPTWEQGFYLLVKNPETDSLIITVMDKHSDSTLDKMVYNIKDLCDKPSMQISKEKFQLQLNSESKLTLSMQLRIMQNALFEATESDSDSDLDDCPSTVSRRKSFNKAPKEIVHIEPLSSATSNSDQIEAFQKSEVAASNASLIQKSTFVQRPEERGRIELTLDYSGTRQKLLVTVHRIANLPLKNPGDIPDPYVKLRLEGPGISPVKHRTKVVLDSCDPVYEHTFEYLLSVFELPAHRLIVTVKNKKLFHTSILGQKIIDLDILEASGFLLRDWFDLQEEEVSD
ncbi:hypothetical protein HUJ05_012984 [Dendroctonus ponderosae]|nr:hypothetical protein HUJ05_012984 [Dendroctonus ponderosae]